MRVTRLKLANVRAIETAEFHFRAGVNLIVGINGVGKSTVLDALASCLSEFVLKKHRIWPRPRILSRSRDIRVGAKSLDVECEFESDGAMFLYSSHMSPGRVSGAVSLSTSTPTSPEVETDSGSAALAVLFATRRAVPSRRAPTKKMVAGGVVSATAGAFSPRELHLQEFAYWTRAQLTLSGERFAAARVLKALQDTVTRLLPDYRNLRVDDGDGGDLLIDRGRATLTVGQLSDGERGVLALVLDVTRRLSQANPQMENPAAEADAVVLIDELELHLHPKWQRDIVRNLTNAFPRCQFVATTHSPQIIGEVEHDRIHVMTDGEVYSPTHSFGVDSSRVLEEIMDAEPRTAEVQGLLSQISKEIGKNRFDSARPLVGQLVEILGKNDPEVTRVRTLLNFMKGAE